MGKFKLSLKLQGFELEIEGDRPDIPAISNAVSRQLTGMLQPIAALTSGEETPTTAVIEGESENGKKPARSSRKRAGGSKSPGDGAPGQAIDFRHEPEKYGNPQQTWSVSEKAIWMLAVLKGVQSLNEVSGPQIAATFNDKFKPAGRVHPPNVTRDLGLAKIQNPPPVGEDKVMWYLTNEGDRQAQQLIQNVLNPTA